MSHALPRGEHGRAARRLLQGRAGDGAAWSWAIAATVALSGLAGAVVPYLLGGRRSALALALVFCGVCLLGISSAFHDGTRPVQMVVWCFSFTWLGVGQVYQLTTGRIAWRDHYLLGQTSVILTAQLLLISTYLALLVGSQFRRARSRRARVTGRPAVTDLVLDVIRLRAVEYVAISVSLLITAVVAVQAGGLQTIFLSRGDRNAALASEGITAGASGAVTGFVRLLPIALATLAGYLAVLRLRSGSQGPLSPWLTVAAAIVVANPVANTRFTSFALLGVLAVAFLQPRGVIAGSVMAALTVSAFVLGYPLVDKLSGKSTQAGTIAEPAFAALAGKDFDGFQMTGNGILFVQENGHGWGEHILSAMFFFVPRSLWEDKPIPASIEIAQFRHYFFTDLSLPLPAEFYLDLGWVGAIVVMLLLGSVIERVDSAWMRAPGTRAAFFAPVLAFASIGAIRGPLLSLVPTFGSVLILTAVAAHLVLRRPQLPKGSARPGGPPSRDDGPSGPRARV
jgi:hypothetical protein